MSLLGGLGPTIIVVMWVETLLAFLFIAARVYSRHFLSQSGGWDDVLTVLTGVSESSKPIPGLRNSRSKGVEVSPHDV